MTPQRRYWVCVVCAIVLIAGSVAVSAALMYGLTRTGSCGTDGTYVAVRPCPAGTGLRILGLIVSIFGTPFLGLAIYALRAPVKGVSAITTAGSLPLLGVLWFFLVFTCMGAAALLVGVGPATPTAAGARDGAKWTGVTFLVMGAPALLGLLVYVLRPRRAAG